MNIVEKIKRKIRGYFKSRQEDKQFIVNAQFVHEASKTSGCNKFTIVDCGFNQGIVASKLLEKLPEFSLVGFEIQQDIQHFVDDVKTKFPDRSVDVIYSAISDKDGTVEYFEPEKWGKNYKGGTTIVENKISMGVDYGTPKVAPAIDFSKWLRENVAEDEFVFVKMDIEGGEYDVIESLFESGAIDLIDVFAIEWHSNKFPEPQRTRYANIEEKLKTYSESNNISVLDWY